MAQTIMESRLAHASTTSRFDDQKRIFKRLREGTFCEGWPRAWRLCKKFLRLGTAPAGSRLCFVRVRDSLFLASNRVANAREGMLRFVPGGTLVGRFPGRFLVTCVLKIRFLSIVNDVCRPIGMQQVALRLRGIWVGGNVVSPGVWGWRLHVCARARCLCGAFSCFSVLCCS